MVDVGKGNRICDADTSLIFLPENNIRWLLVDPNAKAFQLDREMFKVKPATTTLIIVTLALLMALYVKFW